MLRGSGNVARLDIYSAHGIDCTILDACCYEAAVEGSLGILDPGANDLYWNGGKGRAELASLRKRIERRIDATFFCGDYEYLAISIPLPRLSIAVSSSIAGISPRLVASRTFAKHSMFSRQTSL